MLQVMHYIHIRQISTFQNISNKLLYLFFFSFLSLFLHIYNRRKHTRPQRKIKGFLPLHLHSYSTSGSSLSSSPFRASEVIPLPSAHCGPAGERMQEEELGGRGSRTTPFLSLLAGGHAVPKGRRGCRGQEKRTDGGRMGTQGSSASQCSTTR